MGRRDLGGGVSDHDRHPLLQSDKPTQEVMSPPPKLASSHCIRGWCSLVYGQPSCMGQVYQPHPMQDHHCKGEIKWMPQENNGKVVT